MNRNTQEYFGAIPKIHTKRSRFDLSHSVSTCFNNGKLIPIKWYEILPGDTFEVKMSEVLRLTTPLYPTMDNLVNDVYFFFVPNRLLWEHWQNFWGENDDPWYDTIHEYQVPQILSPSETGWAGDTVADYMGLPTGVPNLSSNALPFRAYIKLWNDWFRSENVDSCADLPLGDSTVQGLNTPSGDDTYVQAQKYGITPLPVNKTMDYFTACLPAPQKGPSVGIPIGTSAPIRTTTIQQETGSNTPVFYNMYDIYGDPMTSAGMPAEANQGIYKYGETAIGESLINQGSETVTHSATGYGVPNNLVADLGNATAATVNELRTAFAIQKYYERAAAGGTRYIEWLRSIFGVESSDARLQRSEYIGGTRNIVNMSQIIQTSSTDATSPQGHASGFSCTIEADKPLFTKSFEEHGILMAVMCTRIETHTYQQGMGKEWTRKKWTDYYNPYFAFLGNQPVLNENIYAQGRSNAKKNPNTGKYYDEEVFGYNEAWAEYRYIPNTVTGAMRSNYSGGSLDAWHYADDYDSMPYLSSNWLKEGTAEVDRTLAVSSANAPQFKADIYFDMKATRPMPVYSVPGLIDHV